MAGYSEESKSFDQTPTYSLATVVLVFVAISLLLERGIHHLGKWLKKKHSKPLANALEVMKDELMLLGFISILLSVFQNQIAEICVPVIENNPMLPCAKPGEKPVSYPPSEASDGGHRRLLRALSTLQAMGEGTLLMPHRTLAASSSSGKCPPGKEQFIPTEVNHQLHLFIFFLAIVHVIYSCITMLLAVYKIHRWNQWETEAQEMVNTCMALSNAERVRLMKNSRSSTFVRRHSATVPAGPLPAVRRGLSFIGVDHAPLHEFEQSVSLWLTCFFGQFWHSVGRTDYLTLRMAFISNHNTGLKFDFHGYLLRSMEVDFIYVIGTRFSLWLWVVLVLLLNVHGWNTLFWIDFIPVILALLIGTKLMHVMATLAKETPDSPAFCVGHDMKARDQLFWFNRPKILLYLVHFIIFQNSFELAITFWYMAQFGTNSCLIGNWWFVGTRLALSLLVQFLCSYITLPLYCLVTQMGTHFKKTIFSKKVHSKLLGWASRHKRSRFDGIQEPVVAAASRLQSAVMGSQNALVENVVAHPSKFKSVVRSAVLAERSGETSNSVGSGDYMPEMEPALSGEPEVSQREDGIVEIGEGDVEGRGVLFVEDESSSSDDEE